MDFVPICSQSKTRNDSDNDNNNGLRLIELMMTFLNKQHQWLRSCFDVNWQLFNLSNLMHDLNGGGSIHMKNISNPKIFFFKTLLWSLCQINTGILMGNFDCCTKVVAESLITFLVGVVVCFYIFLLSYVLLFLLFVCFPVVASLVLNVVCLVVCLLQHLQVNFKLSSSSVGCGTLFRTNSPLKVCTKCLLFTNWANS